MSQSGRELYLLIIEDNQGDLLLIEEYLKEEFIELRIYKATTFSQARQILKSNKSFDAILLDLSLPDARGESLVVDMIEMAHSIPVIVLTGYSDKEFGVKTLAMGVSDYLLKDELNSSALNKSISYSIERKRIQTQLNESEMKYRNLFHMSPIPMWVYDVETFQFLSINQAAVKHYGYSKEEFLKMTIKEIRPSTDVTELENIVAKMRLSESSHQGIYRHVKKHGEIIYVDIQSNEIYFNNINARLVLATDISERINYIKAIENQNLKMQEIAWIQSHVVRAPLARIMGLMNILQYAMDEDKGKTKEVLDYILTSANELDEIIKAIIKKTELIEELPETVQYNSAHFIHNNGHI
jgi:PAS domain S-box-containing protein